MINYIYDGTFEGLLTVIAEAVERPGEVNDISAGGAVQPDLFSEIKVIETDPVLADHFFKKLAAGFSRSVIMDIGYCYLSEVPGIEKVILDYIRLLLTAGERAAHNFSDGTVFKLERVSNKVAYEIERLHGFVRFRKLRGGIYYAAIEPDHNVVQYLAPHFKARFADQEWLIHDVKRKTGIYYDGNRCTFLPAVEMSPRIITGSRPFSPEQDSSVFDPEEAQYQKLWDQYFRDIAITERRNKRQQRQRMPARYWRYLVEDVER